MLRLLVRGMFIWWFQNPSSSAFQWEMVFSLVCWGVLWFGICGVREIITGVHCSEVWKWTLVRFDSWWGFMFLFGLRFRRSFVITLLAVFYLVGNPFCSGVLFWGLDFFGCPSILSFFLSESCFYTRTYIYIYIKLQSKLNKWC